MQRNPATNLDNGMLLALREVTEQAAKEPDPEKLHELVLAIDALLDAIERRVAEIDGHSCHLSN